jgi:tyrosine-protein phosphatase SIW14
MSAARRWRRRTGISGGILFCILAGTFGWLTLRTYHYAAVQPGVLYRCGNRGIAEFSNAVGRIHPKTVVSLIDDRELNDPLKPQFRGEANYLANHHIRQVRIPVPLGGWPDSDDIQQFLAIVADPANQPVLIHCAQGVRRTGMFVAAYQESTMGYDPSQAKAAIRSFGHSDSTMEDIRRFIDGYDAHLHTVATTMPSGGSE